MGKKSFKKNIRRTNKRKNTEKTHPIYIVLSKTQTFPSRVIKMWTKEPYAHTSLAFDLELNEMYSFARKRLHNPFYCGFIREDIESGVFGRDVETTCLVLRLWVTANQHKKIRRTVDQFKRNKNSYKYNYLGIAGVVFNKSVERKYNYFCSQFVYTVLDRAEVDLFKKKSGLVRPEDFRVWEEPEVIYEGKLNEYRDFLKNCYPKDIHSGDYLIEQGVNLRMIEIMNQQMGQQLG